MARQVDLRASNTQNILAKVGTIAKCTDNLLKARKKDAKKIDLDEMVSFHTDALALLGHSQYELSLKRCEAIKPALEWLTVFGNHDKLSEVSFMGIFRLSNFGMD